MANQPEPVLPVKRPIIQTGVMTEFGEAVFEDGDPMALAAVDHTYVPGFSDLRIARDTEIALAAKEGRTPKVAPLPMQLRWARRTKVNGAPDETKVQKAKGNGYVPVTKDDVGAAWLTALPDGATILPDGTIGKGDTVLLKCLPKRAAQNAYRKQQLTMDRLGASMAKAEEQGMAIEKVQGQPIQMGSQLRFPD